MRTIKLRLRLITALVFSALMFLSSASKADDLAVISHASVDIDSLSEERLRRIFSGKVQYWPTGDRVVVFVLSPTSEAHQVFCREYLSMFPYQLERLWKRMTFSGQGEPPVIVASMDDLIESVVTTPGAIGYAYSDEWGKAHLRLLEQVSDKESE